MWVAIIGILALIGLRITLQFLMKYEKPRDLL